MGALYRPLLLGGPGAFLIAVLQSIVNQGSVAQFAASCRDHPYLVGSVAVVYGLSTYAAKRSYQAGNIADSLVAWTASGPPEETTELVGRQADVTAVRNLLIDDGARLVSLIGPGGVGKTRLAMRVAKDVDGYFPDGVVCVWLEAITDPNLVLPSIAARLGVRERSGVQLLDQVKDYLHRRRTLLVLDNFEQLAGSASLITELRSAAAGLQIVVTTRQRLRVDGERLFPVRPLGSPGSAHVLPVEQIATFPAVQLFVQRAREANLAFALTEQNAQAVAEICSRLDGLPLAIKLAAAWCEFYAPEALVERMDLLRSLSDRRTDAPARHWSLADAINWSYRLLHESEQRLFRQLAVFSGGFTVSAVCSIVGATEEHEQMAVVEQVRRLTERSLLQQDDWDDDPRFTMLLTIHEFASSLLDADGAAAEVRKRHALFYMALAEEAERESWGPNQGRCFDRLEKELDNLRAAFRWNPDEPIGAETRLRLATALSRFWFVRGRAEEGCKWLEEVLAAPVDVSIVALAKATNAAGFLARLQRNYQRALELHESALSLYREAGHTSGIISALNDIGTVELQRGFFTEAKQRFQEALAFARESQDTKGIALSLDNLGNLARDEGNFAEATKYLEESFSWFQETNNPHALAWTRHNQGDIGRDQADYDLAVERYEASLAIFSELDDKGGIAWSHHALGNVAQDQGRYDIARQQYARALELFRKLNDRHGVAWTYHNLGNMDEKEGSFPSAIANHEQCLALFDELGDRRGTSWTRHNLARVARKQGKLRLATALLEQSLTQFREIGDRRGIAWSLNSLAEVALARHSLDHAACLFAIADAMRTDINVRLSPPDQIEHDESMELLRSEFDDTELSQAWQRCQHMQLEEAITYATSALQATQSPTQLPTAAEGSSGR